MSDSFMSPLHVYRECERVFGRPVLDPCWHPLSPIRPLFAISRHCKLGVWTDPDTGCKVDVVARDGLSPKILWTSFPGWKWLNPPYSAPEDWTERITLNRQSVSLIKCDPSTRWWLDDVWNAPPVSFTDTAVGMFHDRLHYPDADGMTDPNQANFPSSLVVRGLEASKLRLKRITWINSWRTVN